MIVIWYSIWYIPSGMSYEENSPSDISQYIS